MDFIKVNVGEKYSLSNESTWHTEGTDGAVLEALEQEGLWLSVFLKQPKADEISTFTYRSISVRILKEGDMVLPLVQFGNKMIFEMSFDPTLYDDARAFQIKDKNNLLTFVLVDNSSGIVRGLRRANLPRKFIQICVQSWAKAFLQTDFSERYAEWYTQLQAQPIERLWMKAEYVGKMGEVYNLDEVH